MPVSQPWPEAAADMSIEAKPLGGSVVTAGRICFRLYSNGEINHPTRKTDE